MSSFETLLWSLTLVASLASALVAGIFLAFSNFVMKALARIPPASGMAAMQSVNITVINPVFLGLFLGNAAACLILAAAVLWHWPSSGGALILSGSLAYLIGTFLVTMAFNVPRNDALAPLDSGSEEAVAKWRTYVDEWTKYNHLRTLFALLAAACFMGALIRLVAE